MSPMRREEYPDDWEKISLTIRIEAGWRCEGSPEHPDCRARNGKPHPVTGSKVVLTVAHLDHDKQNNSRSNLRALCQRCHLNHDRHIHLANRHRNARARALAAGQGWLPGLEEVAE